MPDSYDDLARRHQGSAAAAAFKFISQGSSGYSNASQLDYYSQALAYAVQHLLAWGLTGHEPSLKAFQGLVRQLPSSGYPVSFSSSQIYEWSDQIDNIPRKLQQTRSEAQEAVKRLNRDLRMLDANAPITRVHAEDIRERIAFYDSIDKDLNERIRKFRDEEGKLKLKAAKTS